MKQPSKKKSLARSYPRTLAYYYENRDRIAEMGYYENRDRIAEMGLREERIWERSQMHLNPPPFQ